LFRASNFEFDSSFEFRISNFLLAVCLLWARTVRADPLSLPLHGYFHPGRAMPVKWDGGQMAELSASGAITTRMPAPQNPRGIFPWIVARADASHASSAALGPLHPLEDSDCLVADAVGNDSDARLLFGDRRLITIHLDGDELTGAAMAWETLDAIVLSSAALEKIPEPMRRQLFAEGVELAVLSDGRPDAALPWNRAGRWWIASPPTALPTTICPDAYAPTWGWDAGRSPAFRGRILLFGAIHGLLVCGVGLWRSRWMPAGIAAVSILAAAVFAVDNHRQSPIFRRSGVVRLTGAAVIEDDWLFQVSHRQAAFSLPLEDSVHPIFYDESQVESVNLVLDCDGRGQPVAITGVLSADEPLALMRRRMATEGVDGRAAVQTATSPSRLLATEPIYPGFTLIGQLDAPVAEDSWPTVVLSRTASQR
jgi:hypothetical protein